MTIFRFARTSLRWLPAVALASAFLNSASAAGVLTLQIGSPAPPPTPVVNHGDSWHWRKGTNAPQSSWQTVGDALLDSSWLTGNGGFGYADNVPETVDCATLVTGMQNVFSTLYMRRLFTIGSAPDPSSHLQMRMDFDDGFIAWLDGIYLTNRFITGAPTEPAFNALANTSHESSHGTSGNAAENYDFGLVGSRLAPGTHVLAIIGVNNTLGSSDLIQVADLSAASGSGSSTVSGNFFSIVFSNSVVLSGSNTVVGSTRVTINGDDAVFNSGNGTWSKTNALVPGMNQFFIAAIDANGNLLASTNRMVVSEVSSTSVGGTLPLNSTWNPGMGIIHLTSTAIVPPGGSLSIEPGTVVLATPGASILATNCSLTATGTPTSPVYFLPADGSSVWGELAISGGTGTMLLQHIETIEGHIEVFDGAVGTIEDSYIHNYQVNSPAIIHTLGQPNHCTLNLRRIHVAHYYEILSQLCTNLFDDCLMEEVDVLSGDGIDFDAGQPGSHIRRCTVRYGRLTNIDALDMGEIGAEASRGVLIDSCLLHDFVDKGVSMGVAVDVTVTNTLLYNLNSGIAVKDNSICGFYGNTIADVNFGYNCYNKANPASPSGGGAITNSFNNLVWATTNDTIILSNGSTLVATFTDLYNTNWPGDGNFTADPLFLNSAAHDYHVAPGSPTLGAGLNGANVGVTFPVGGIPSMPANFAAIANGTSPIQLVWQDTSDNEDGVLAERSTDGSSWTAFASAAANATSLLDTTGVLGQKYYYRVRATNSSGVSPYSNIASGTRQVAQVTVGGTISSDTVWASGSHYIVTSAVTVNSGVTLTIQPGVSVCFNTGLGMTIANGGRLLANGTSNAPILFTRSPSNLSTWTGLTINGAVGSPETQISYAHFEFTSQDPCILVSAGTVLFDHLTFGNAGAAYIHLDGASFIVQNCVFQKTTAGLECVHGTGGIRSDGHGVFLRNFWGGTSGYNDLIDFTGGNRPGPIIHFLDNVLIGASDDMLDLDGTDAWVEHNIFMHSHKNGSPDTSSCVSSGDDSGNSSEITIIGNLIFDVDHAAMDKGSPPGFFTLINNTIVHQNHSGGTDTDGAVVCLADETFRECSGMYLEGNIIADAEKLMRFHTNSIVTYTNNIIATNGNWTTNLLWTGPGGNNSTNDPLFKSARFEAGTGWMVGSTNLNVFTSNMTSWAQAQVLWDWFSLKTNSPAIGTGPNGLDKGGVIPIGASVSGAPTGTTTQSNATLVVGINRTGNGILSGPNNFPLGSGYTAYKWRLDGGALSAETPIGTPITLSNLSAGPHTVQVSGKRDSGLYQDNTFFGVEALLTTKTWTVGSAAPHIDSISRSGSVITISFIAQAGQSYSLLGSDIISPADWQKVPGADVNPPLATGTVTRMDTNATSSTRFYKLVTPQQP